MQIRNTRIPGGNVVDADRGATRCPYATPQVYIEAGRPVWQCCEGGMWVTYNVDTLKELSRELHTYCEGTGRLRH
jgi:hypothetical protein